MFEKDITGAIKGYKHGHCHALTVALHELRPDGQPFGWYSRNRHLGLIHSVLSLPGSDLVLDAWGLQEREVKQQHWPVGAEWRPLSPAALKRVVPGGKDAWTKSHALAQALLDEATAAIAAGEAKPKRSASAVRPMPEPEFWRRVAAIDWPGIVARAKAAGRERRLKAPDAASCRIHAEWTPAEITSFDARAMVLHKALDVSLWTWMSAHGDPTSMTGLDDDGYGDLLAHVIGSGRKVYERELVKPWVLINRAHRRDFYENFYYLLQDWPETCKTPKRPKVVTLYSARTMPVAARATQGRARGQAG